MKTTTKLVTCVASLCIGSGAHAEDPFAPPATDPPPTDPMAPTPAVAEEPDAEIERDEAKVHHDRIVALGLKLGGAFNVFNTLGAAFVPELEVGVLLPPLEQSFEVFLATRWAAPSDEGVNDPDPRLPGDGVARWSLTRHEVSIGLGLRYRVPLDGALTPYVAAGARLFLLESEVSGEAGDEPFGTNRETGTAVGFMFQLGAEYALGPGALALELAIDGAALDQTILADTNVTALGVFLGYRLFL